MSSPLDLQPLPRLHAALGASGGVYKEALEDFEVEELAEQEPSGAGSHLYVWVEKRGLTTEAAATRLAEAAGIDARDVGYAGQKDRQAVTRQWLSLPMSAEGKLAGAESDALHILRTSRHTEKLRAGHLRGNRFRLRLRRIADREALGRIVSALDTEGLANFYGPQRFGDGGSTLAMGLALLRGEKLEHRPGARLLRLALSAVQSALFNAALRERHADGLVSRIVPGDVVELKKSGILAWSVDAATDEARYQKRELVPTGPMFGTKMRWPQRDALDREQGLLERAGLTMQSFAAHAKLMHGTRRPYVVYPEKLELDFEGEDAWLTFSLPSGSYATVLLAEVGVEEARRAPAHESSGESAAG